MQHSASPRAVLTTRHSPRAVFFIHLHGSALTITYYYMHTYLNSASSPYSTPLMLIHNHVTFTCKIKMESQFPHYTDCLIRIETAPLE